MTDLIFSFDTEDFTSKESMDTILEEANLFHEEGVRGCFCLVGLLAKHMKEWGREDVIEALSHHEIDSHTYGHTLHPMINEYTDIEDANEAIARVIKEESLAIDYIKDTMGARRIYAAVPPGNQKSYAAMYAYAKMGIPIYADTFCDPLDGSGSYYCNIYHIAYVDAMESIMHGEEEDIRRLLDRLAQRKRSVLYTHPNMARYSEFWDQVNYHKENLVPFGQWKMCKRRSEAETQHFYKNLRTLIRLVKADPRFRITTYEEITAELEKAPARTVTAADLPAIRAQLAENFFPVKIPCSLSLSDLMLACRDLLLGKPSHTCGDVYGFLSAPKGIAAPITVTAEAIRASATQIGDGFLPEEIRVGETAIGPRDWLIAALSVLSGEEAVTLTPAPQLPCLDLLPEVRDSNFRGTWQHSDSFMDRYLSDRLRYQSWTMRF
ncbi:MAG: hypothetical protein J6D21_00655 [Clostridia bacterium]|nr:hypothetical protein [Clostridia bacterium]